MSLHTKGLFKLSQFDCICLFLTAREIIGEMCKFTGKIYATIHPVVQVRRVCKITNDGEHKNPKIIIVRIDSWFP